MIFYKSKTGYFYKQYKNGKKIRISKKEFLKNNKMYGGDKNLKAGNIVDVIIPFNAFNYYNNNNRLISSNTKITIVQNNISSDKDVPTHQREGLSIIKVNPIHKNLLNMEEEKKYYHDYNKSEKVKSYTLLNNTTGKIATYPEWYVIPHVEMKRTFIRTPETDSDILKNNNFYLEAHGNEPLLIIDSTKINEIDTEIKSHYDKIKELFKDIIKSIFNKYTPEQDNIVNDFVQNLVKDGEEFSNITKDNKGNDFSQLTYLDRDVKYFTWAELIDNLWMEVLQMNNVPTKLMQLFSRDVDEIKNSSTPIMKQHAIKWESIKKNLNDSFDNLRTMYSQPLADIPLYSGQKVILLCHPGCYAMSDDQLLSKMLTEEDNLIQILENGIPHKSKSFCVYENRVPNISLTFIEHKNRKDYNQFGLWQLPIEGINPLWDDSNGILTDNVNSWNVMTGFSHDKLSNNLDTIQESTPEYQEWLQSDKIKGMTEQVQEWEILLQDNIENLKELSRMYHKATTKKIKPEYQERVQKAKKILVKALTHKSEQKQYIEEKISILNKEIKNNNIEFVKQYKEEKARTDLGFMIKIIRERFGEKTPFVLFAMACRSDIGYFDKKSSMANQRIGQQNKKKTMDREKKITRDQNYKRLQRRISVQTNSPILLRQSTVGGEKVRKHQGIHQKGGNKGRLKKGYKYSGKKLKSGLSEIIKCSSKNVK